MPWSRSITDGPIVLGICAMAKKAHSGPMTQTLDRMRAFSVDGRPEFQVIYFEEAQILNAPVEEWPLCDALIAFFSTGFPLHKAQAYAKLRTPFVFNNLDKQEWLFDRRRIYMLLGKAGVPVPKHVVLNADEPNEVEESEDYLQINGVRINKPLVEKPVSGEDHNIYLYYPRSQGGGSKRLFRKVKDRSSQFYPDIHTTRVHDGNSYIYEELLQTEGTDVKVYAIGPEYAHAEARKSPVVDGKVRRNVRGKEERYPVILDAEEKSIARKVVLTFGQTVCGFDLLRSNGRSYVCDVNGWSFVKDSHKFWSDSANLLRQYALEALVPAHLWAHPDGNQLAPPEEEPSKDALKKGRRAPKSRRQRDSPSRFPTPEDAELLCVVALTRHGDRTPKEKLKFHTREPAFLSMICEQGSSTVEELKIKNVRLMEEITRRVCDVVATMQRERKARAALGADAATDGAGTDDDFEKLLTVRQVLTSHPFRGINRKVQLKPTKWERAPATSDDGIERLATDGPEANALPTEALFILKWGGELTSLGESQAEHLGTTFRNLLYPGEFGGVLRLHATYRHDLKIYASEEGRVQMTAAAFAKGFLDLDGNLTPILASLVSKNEQVTQMLDETPDSGRSAMDVAKAHIHKVLSIDEAITDDDVLALLPSAEAEHAPAELPAELYAGAPVDVRADGTPTAGTPTAGARAAAVGTPSRLALTDALDGARLPARSPLIVAAPTASSLLLRSLRTMGNPKQALYCVQRLLDDLVKELKLRAAANAGADDATSLDEQLDGPAPLARERSSAANWALDYESGDARSPRSDHCSDGEGAPESDAPHPANGESAHLQYSRWNKLRKDFYKAKKGQFDTTKIPDIYDNAMYDVLHNEHLRLASLPDLYRATHTLASYVVPQEYGIEKHDKVHIGLQIGSVLLRKIHHDLLAGTSPSDHEQERVHQLDTSHTTDVRTPQRHVRTRLYFTSESHIHSLFNVLRWGSDVSHMSGDTVSSIFSDEARAQFDDMELCYLTHVVFRVLHKKGKPSDERSSYMVQVLVSPGVNQDLRKGESRSTVREQMVTTPMVLSSRDDLTLEHIDEFINFFVRRDTEYIHAAPAQDGASDLAGDSETSKAQSAVKNQYLSISPGHPDGGMLPPPMRTPHAPAFGPHSEQLLNWNDLHGENSLRRKREPIKMNARSRALSGVTGDVVSNLRCAETNAQQPPPSGA